MFRRFLVLLIPAAVFFTGVLSVSANPIIIDDVKPGLSDIAILLIPAGLVIILLLAIFIKKRKNKNNQNRD